MIDYPTSHWQTPQTTMCGLDYDEVQEGRRCPRCGANHFPTEAQKAEAAEWTRLHQERRAARSTGKKIGDWFTELEPAFKFWGAIFSLIPISLLAVLLDGGA